MAKRKEEKEKAPFARDAAYPLALQGELREPLSRGLWLVKWLLLVPHLIVLCFLWIAAVFVWIIAFFAILFTGQYPRPLFGFTVGVLRWSWRVSFYGYGALATDKYPPFRLGKADYPADLDVEYPEDLARWMPLVKWLFAVPHYACVAALSGASWKSFPFVGLLPVLIAITAVLLLFTGKYRQEIWKLVMGVNRWSFRVAAYALLLTDRYPPFRLSE
jgi:hypothetical protein